MQHVIMGAEWFQGEKEGLGTDSFQTASPHHTQLSIFITCIIHYKFVVPEGGQTFETLKMDNGHISFGSRKTGRCLSEEEV